MFWVTWTTTGQRSFFTNYVWHNLFKKKIIQYPWKKVCLKEVTWGQCFLSIDLNLICHLISDIIKSSLGSTYFVHIYELKRCLSGYQRVGGRVSSAEMQIMELMSTSWQCRNFFYYRHASLTVLIDSYWRFGVPSLWSWQSRKQL